VFAAGTIASLVMVLQHDSVSFAVTPLSLGPPPGTREGKSGAALPNGLALALRF
jgi:hypothetical protein